MHSIRTKILAIALVFLAFTGAAFLFYSLLTTAYYKDLRHDGIKKTVEYETQKVNTMIAEIERSATFVAMYGSLLYKNQSEERGQSFILDYMRSFPTAIGVGFWFEPYAYDAQTLRAGAYAYFDKEAGELRLDDSLVMAEYDYHNFTWYRELVAALKEPGQVAWDQPYVDDNEFFSLITTAGAGLFDQDGKLIAVSTIDWEIQEVVEELSAIKPSPNSFVLLCAPEQNYIISSTYAGIAAGAPLDQIPWDINADAFALDGTSYLSFSRIMDNGWQLSVLIPEKEIYYEVVKQNSRFSLLIALFSLLMLGVVYYLISKLINTPIKQLTADVSQLSLGNLDVRVDLAKLAANDELGLLAKTFNEMMTELKESIDENERERAEVARISTELNIAAAIQASMLPCVAFPPFPNRAEFDLFASMRPAKEVGGDFYDFFMVDEHNLAVIIADVSGKGVPAALFMVVTMMLFRNDAGAGKSPREVMEAVNKTLCESNEADMFVTAFMGYYNWETGRLVYVNAGHNPPLIKSGGQEYRFLQAKPGLFLAFMEDATFREEELFLGAGDVLYLYTDGVTEAMNPEYELFSDPRLLAVMNQYLDYPAEELLPALKQEIDNFVNGAEQSDDLTMLALKVNSVGTPAKTRLTVPASMDNLETVLDFVNNALEWYNGPKEIIGDVSVAVEEIFVNIVSYAYNRSERGEVEISVRPPPPELTPGENAGAKATDRIVISFADHGNPFNPLEKADPDLNQPPAERPIGGLGIFLVKQLMDKVEYSYQDQQNVLTITKFLIQ